MNTDLDDQNMPQPPNFDDYESYQIQGESKMS